ncbi:MAG: acyl-CoA dehydrogenase N-terminal domain-containing protein [Burkholderiaceae bacterium]
MTERLVARRDIEFLLYDWLEVQSFGTLPRVDPQLDLLASLDTTALDMQQGWF